MKLKTATIGSLMALDLIGAYDSREIPKIPVGEVEVPRCSSSSIYVCLLQLGQM